MYRKLQVLLPSISYKPAAIMAALRLNYAQKGVWLKHMQVRYMA